MSHASSGPLLRGIIPPLVTPLLGPDELDEDALARLIEHLLNGGVSGIFVLGTTGEGPSLSTRLQRELIRRACHHVRGRVPVLVGITDASLPESIALARDAADAGAAAVVVAPPPYFPTAQAELIGYLRRLCAASPLPVVLYNLPLHTKVRIEPETVRQLADVPGVIALKDSSGNMLDFHRTRLALEDRPDFALLVGPEELLAESVLLGAHGGVSGGANLFPSLYVRLHQAAQAGDLATTRRLHGCVMRVSTRLYGVSGYGSSMLRGLKSALELRGLCRNVLAEPFTPFSPEEQERIRRHLQELLAQDQDDLTAPVPVHPTSGVHLVH